MAIVGHGMSMSLPTMGMITRTKGMNGYTRSMSALTKSIAALKMCMKRYTMRCVVDRMSENARAKSMLNHRMSM